MWLLQVLTLESTIVSPSCSVLYEQNPTLSCSSWLTVAEMQDIVHQFMYNYNGCFHTNRWVSWAGPTYCQRIPGSVLWLIQAFLNYLWSGYSHPCADLSIGRRLCAACFSGHDWLDPALADGCKATLRGKFVPRRPFSMPSHGRPVEEVNKRDDSFAFMHQASCFPFLSNNRNCI